MEIQGGKPNSANAFAYQLPPSRLPATREEEEATIDLHELHLMSNSGSMLDQIILANAKLVHQSFGPVWRKIKPWKPHMLLLMLKIVSMQHLCCMPSRAL